MKDGNLLHQQEWSLQDVHVMMLPFSGMDLGFPAQVNPLSRKRLESVLQFSGLM